MQGEFDPVDNRADKKVSGEGGGSPGELGGLGSVAFLAPASGETPEGAGLDPAADALLSEILPTTVQKPPEDLKRALPGPQTTGLGLVPGPGAGGGGGSGGGSGGGVGRGIGPGTEFFGAKEHGRSFAYVIDCSGSMATRELAGGGQARAAGQPQSASPRRPVLGDLLQPQAPGLHRPQRASRG